MRGFHYQDLGENLFILHFNHPLDRTHAMEGCPWLLDRHALLLALIPPDVTPEAMVLTEMNIVVRLNDVPVSHRNPDMARKLCAMIGSVLEVIPPKGEYYQAYIQVKVQIDISEPIVQGMFLRMANGVSKWISFTYERLPVYCYLCGIIRHLEMKCDLRFRENIVDPG